MTTPESAPVAGAPVLEVVDAVVRFGAVRALDGVRLSLSQGEFVVVLGPTGAGKTTLLRAIAGLEPLEGGAILWRGRDAAGMTPADRDVALVFQNFSLYPSRTVRENLEFPLRSPRRRLQRAEIAERVAWAAKLLGIERLLDRPARRLSGGEMQRVAIGRAIVKRPAVFLMDEPLSNLDAKLREELRVELHEIARGLAAPVLWVTHDHAEALSMADRVVVLGAGRVLQEARPEEVYRRPASPAVARLLGTPPMNLIAVERHLGHWVTADGTHIVAADADEGDRATVGFRPEHVDPLGGDVDGTIEIVEDLGSVRLALVRWGGERIRVIVSRGDGCLPGNRLRPKITRDHVVVWPTTRVPVS